MYNYLQYVQSLCSPYTEQTASGLPNPTQVEGEVRFFQAQDQPSVTTHVRVGYRVFSHSLDVVSKMHIHIIYSHFFTCTMYLAHMTNMATMPTYGKRYSNIFFFRTIRHMTFKSNRIAMNRNWSNQKPNPALKTKMGNKLQIDKRQREHMANRAGSYFPKGSHSAIQTELEV